MIVIEKGEKRKVESERNKESNFVIAIPIYREK
jgi:hypothetical protein